MSGATYGQKQKDDPNVHHLSLTKEWSHHSISDSKVWEGPSPTSYDYCLSLYLKKVVGHPGILRPCKKQTNLLLTVKTFTQNTHVFFGFFPRQDLSTGSLGRELHYLI